MVLPSTYAIALLIMLFSMLCWGSWANLLKLSSPLRFELFYWDYALGVLLVSLVMGLTFGNLGATGLPLFADLAQASWLKIGDAFAAGIVFNFANILLVVAIAIAGLSVAFPIGIGLALVIGVVMNYLITPRGNVFLLFGGVILVCLAILVDALAYRRHLGAGKRVTWKGIGMSLLCGVGMGLFYPLVAKSISGENHLGPYAVAVVFALGVVVCTVLLNYLLMRYPLTAPSQLNAKDYFLLPGKSHLFGLLGGIIWGAGMASNFVASTSAIVGPAIAYAIGQGATMVSALWGILLWREFAGASRAVRMLLTAMFALFIVGLGMISLAPVWVDRELSILLGFPH